MKKGTPTFSIVLVASAVANAQSGSPHYTPSKVTIKPEKTELMPGEEIDLVLTDFVDYGGSFVGEARMVRVRAEKGSIWNLHTWVRNSGYMFQIGSGEDRRQVPSTGRRGEGRAAGRRDRHKCPPLRRTDKRRGRRRTDDRRAGAQDRHCRQREDEVPRVLQERPGEGAFDNGHHRHRRTPPRNAQARPSVEPRFHSVDSASAIPTGSRRPPSTVPPAPSAARTAATASYPPHRRTGTPRSWSTTTRNGAIESVKLPLISAILNWVGDGECVPPESVEIGPVTEWDDESDQKKLERLADEIEVDMETVNRGIPTWPRS